MFDSTLYLSDCKVDIYEIIKSSNSCSMYKRMIINAEIKTVIVCDTVTECSVIEAAG